jgi:pSer/pThr/pTyr-binding forkhead associated (FHA) protein
MKLFFPNAEHSTVDLAEGVIVIGSSPTCQIVLGAGGVTPRHCELRTQGGRSQAGPIAIGASTRLNGSILTGLTEIRGGDLLQIANISCRVVATERRASPPAEPKPPSLAAWDRTRVRMVLPKFVLRGVSGATFGKRFAVKGNMVVGRSGDCDICIASEEISRHHAHLTLVPDGVMVEDLGSSNGTFVNDKRVGGVTLLRPGDELRMDVVRFLLTVPGKETQPLPAAPAAPAALAPATRWKTMSVVLTALALIALAAIAIFALRYGFRGQ